MVSCIEATLNLKLAKNQISTFKARSDEVKIFLNTLKNALVWSSNQAVVIIADRVSLGRNANVLSDSYVLL